MSLFFRRISVFGRFAFMRLLQVRDNPKLLIHLLKKNLIYKRSKIDFAQKYAGFQFLSAQETLLDLINNNKSLARFSDGEFEQLIGSGEYPPDSDWCQKWSPSLQQDISTSLSCTDSRLLVAVDPPSTFLAAKNSQHAIRFEYKMWVDMRRIMWKFLSKTVPYGHCHLFIKANCPDFDWHMFREYLSDKDIIIATGNTVKIRHLSIGRNTFFIECGTENAYERRHTIKEDIRNEITTRKLDKHSTIVFASLGPTAGILAYDFLNEGIKVWDTGHMFEFAAKDFLEKVFS
jgi:hypothetical protein